MKFVIEQTDEKNWKTKYLRFYNSGLLREGAKTNVYHVYNLNYIYLGCIKWSANWRQYTFFPDTNTMFNDDCLYEMSEFCTYVTSKYKKKALKEFRERRIKVLIDKKDLTNKKTCAIIAGVV